MRLSGLLFKSFALVLVFAISSYAQISEGGKPASFSKSLPVVIDTKVMPSVDVAAFLAEDEVEKTKDVPFRFGAPFDVHYTLDNSGSWTRFPDGSSLWRLVIKSEGAYSINLLYDRFWLPEGAKLYIYNEDKSMVIGAFTHRNNKDHGEFATSLVQGDVCILEYYEPAEVSAPGIINISRVVHAYRNIYSHSFVNDKSGYGNSGSCNNNVACPEGDDWRNEIRSVAMVILGNGTRWCSGSLVNNVREDLTPYFLTANHCLGGESNWILMFNYQSPSCSNINGPTYMTVQGTTLLASYSFSDFALVLMDEQPPDSFDVYYSGWSAVDTAADSCVAIHHPSGDIKKISFNTDPLTSTSWLGTSSGVGSHWRVDDWEDGTTEGGSSGSPIYNYDHHIIGQLHGGYASCYSITSDWYGKIAKSWANGGLPKFRLKEWLDPDNTGTLVLDGRDGSGITILHTALEDTRDSVNNYEVVATIRSDVALKTDSLFLYYEIAAVETEILLTPTGSPDEYNGFIPAQPPGTIIDYYLTAVDVEGKTDTSMTFSFKIVENYAMTLTTSVISPGIIQFSIRQTVPSDSAAIKGQTNGFRIYSPDGAFWSYLSYGWNTTHDWETWYDLLTEVKTFSVDGALADTIGFGGARMVGPGVAPGFDGEAYQITIIVSGADVGKTLCIDSAYFPPNGTWTWSNGVGVVPSWSGESCFTIEAGCCVGVRGDVNGDNANLDIVDLTCLIDFLFGEGCEMPCPEEADVDGNDEGPDIVDLTFMVDYLFGVTPTLVDCP